MTLETKINWSLGLSITSIIVIVILVIMWFCNVWELSVIGIETFIGVIVALLAIIVTFVVGWQIYNTIEIRNKLSELDKLESEIEQQKLLIENSVYQSRHLIAFTWAINHHEKGNYAEAFGYALQSLPYTMRLNNPINIDTLMDVIVDSAKKVLVNTIVEKDFYNEMILDDREIRDLSNYVYIKGDYEEAFNMYIKKIKINDR
jgi:uncharacterized membrane protein (DUF485 family)